MPTVSSRSCWVGAARSSMASIRSLIVCMPSSRVSPRKQSPLVGAVADVGPQRGLEAAGLGEAELARRQRHVDSSVEHQPADLLREQLGVRRAQLGAVGGAEVGQRGLPERGPDDVEVASGLDGRDVADQGVGALDAALEEGLLAGGERRLLLRVVGVRVGGDEVVELVVGEAVDRVGVTGAARVEPDDVEAVEQLGPEGERCLLGVVGAGHTGAAGVDHQRSDHGARDRARPAC